jgi:hypothetical protein
MAKVSSKTVRILEIPQEVEQSEFHLVAKHLSSKSIGGGWFRSNTPGDENPRTSFASQFEGHVATITLNSEKHKTEVLRYHGTKWRFDDKFDGATVLYSPQDPDIEYV